MKVSPCLEMVFHGSWSGKGSCYATICNQKHRETVQSPSSKIEVFLHFFQLTLLNCINSAGQN